MAVGGNRVDQSIHPLASRVMPIPFSGCWIWLGRADRHGYGRVIVNGKDMFAHRFSWEQHRGPVDGAHVLHKCDVPACVNPDHLFLGSQADNIADMLAKGRHGGQKAGETHRRTGWNVGEKAPTAKLTNEQAIEIFAAPGFHEAIARRFGVSRRLVGRIKSGDLWGRVTGAGNA